MSNMAELLQQGVDEGVFRPLDRQFGLLVGGNSPGVMLAAALVSREAGEGHVCLPLSLLVPEAIAPRHPQLAAALLAEAAVEPQSWEEALASSPAVGYQAEPTPLVLENGRLYLNRYWHYEQQVANFFRPEFNANPPVQHAHIAQILAQLFAPQPDIDWQKIAAAVAMTRRITTISGGPGTGKTTTVAKLLAAFILLEPARRWRICLAAPTGKAAARLSESLGQVVNLLPLSPEVKAQVPQEAQTLHRLLGLRPDTPQPRYHAANPLHLDVLVVDEASMVDLSLMARLIDALPPQARVIFLGDKDQLASVEAGAVLGDICYYAGMGYRSARAAELSQLTGYALAPQDDAPAKALRDGLCLLQKSYRFNAQSGIGRLASAVNANNGRDTLRILAEDYRDLDYQRIETGDDYHRMIDALLQGYDDYLALLTQQPDPLAALAAFNRFQPLCALRDGPFGVSGLNERITSMLRRAGRLEQTVNGQPWYHGRPVMITRNDSPLGLFNGDIGIALRGDDGLRVWFPMTDGTLRSVPSNRLPAHETVWAMTVHKSQGSEFEHVSLVLPDSYLPLLSCELVYTAITRAKQRFSLYANDKVLVQTVATRTRRRSGLAEKLAD